MEEQIEHLISYCSAQKLSISSALRPTYSETSGLGIYVSSPIKRGQRLIHAPKSALLTTASIPSDFLPDQQVRQDLTVHGLLAAWLAFGRSSILEERYGSWMKVWPTWASFRNSMPVFWHAQLFKPTISSIGHESPQTKRRKTSSAADLASCPNESVRNARDFSLCPAIEGWLRPFMPSHKTLRDQIVKLRSILTVLYQNHKLLGFDIMSDQSHTQYENFLHMWCCVNTRCFYYVGPGEKAPKDPNEAMAMVPFLDLFNHTTDGKGADVKFGKDGFNVIADRDYAVGEEVYIQYGSHSNDALWIEYGFILDNNSYDELDFDQLILNSLNEKQKELLASTNYMGEYTLNASEVSYRMEIVAWLACGALSSQQWEDMVLGFYDPEAEQHKKYQKMRLSMKRQIGDWLVAAKQACEQSLNNLVPMQKDVKSSLSLLAPSDDLLPVDDAGGDQERLCIASDRLELCLMRWRQVYAMCITTLERLAKDHPAAIGSGVRERHQSA